MLARHRDVGAERPRGQAVAHHVHQRLVAREIGGEFCDVVHAVLPIGAGPFIMALRPGSHLSRFAVLPHKENPMPAKRPAPRLPLLEESQLTEAQRALLGSLRASPRGQSLTLARTFRGLDARAGIRRAGAGAWRALPLQVRRCSRGCPNSQFCARRAHGARNMNGSRMRLWPSEPASSRRPSPICAPAATPKSAPKDERAIYAFVQELYKTKRVSDRSYKRVHGFLGDAARSSWSASSAITPWCR